MDYNISLREIEYVLTVYQEKNVTQAANKLYISQPSLSQAIKKIEDKVGFLIFTRTKKGLYPSIEGEAFINACGKIMKAMRDCENEISNINSLKKGKLIVGMPFYLGYFIMPPVISEFKKAYPDIEIIIREQNSAELENELLNGEIDIAITPLPLNSQTLDYTSLRKSSFVLVMSKDDPHNRFAVKKDDGKIYVDIRDVADSPFITGYSGQRIRNITDDVFKKCGISPPIAAYSRNIKTIQRFAATGLGVAIVPDMYISDRDDFCSNLNIYNIDPEQCLPWTVAAVYTHNDYFSTAAQRFLSMMVTIVPTLNI